MRRREFMLTAAAAATLRGGPLNRDEVDRARRLIEESEPKIASSTLLVRQGTASGTRRERRGAEAEKIYLIASLTKPFTAAGVMLLQDRGELKLSDPAVKYLPEFSEGDRRRITIRHLLTHTSGLPDQLPENVEMRRRHAPLREFVERALRTPLLFTPGERYSYQSMGILLAAEIAERVTGRPFRDFLADEVFEPLEMSGTALGMGPFALDEVERNQVEHSEPLYGGDPGAASWDWNSPYWRDLGSPWGGAHSTAADYARFLESFLVPEKSPLRAETARAMLADHNEDLDTPRGLGFALGPKALGEGCSTDAFGHGGATGCLAWADPAKDLIFVLLTTLPARVSNKTALRPASDIISRAA